MQKNLSHGIVAACCIALSTAATSETIVASNLRDPMEITIAPSGDLFVVEREGRVLRVHPTTGAMFFIGTIPVTALRIQEKSSNWAREDGLLGITIDPAFETNQRLYLYYSAPDKMLNRLSRFTLNEGLIDLKSEKMILEIPTDRRDKVCHQAGSLSFGTDGLLYLSTGDNTNPFESGGVAPIDDRDGRDHCNAMRSAGNTNDLRGKVLRIKPTEKGYDIPAGNLFKPGTPKTRPEIFVMGCRNPFRLSLDPKTHTVYWGEVGPDANSPNNKGPAGHDEVNQAKTAGNHGWPFCVGNNKPYPIVDFATGKITSTTDPAAPINPGTHNTGLRELPPARSALIWYPYADSAEFPLVGKGGRNAMAGPVFYFDAKRKYNIFNKEDDHTLITYDWMRNKAWKVKLDAQENISGMTVFLEGLQHPMDMEVAADGTIYLLEYGSDWYFNTNGKIRRILPDQGNQAPKIAIKKTSATQFDAVDVSDPEKEAVTIKWYHSTNTTDKEIGKGATITISDITSGELRAVATDPKGSYSAARFSFEAPALPPLTIKLAGKPASASFGQTLNYEVSGAKDQKTIAVRARYIPPTGHDAGGPAFSDDVTKLITSRQCLACHQIDTTSVGPRYFDVSMRYRSDTQAMEKLRSKLKTGGAGAWGEIPMPPQAAVSDQEATTIINAILGLSAGSSEAKGSAKGQLILPPAPASAAPNGAWEIIAEASGNARARILINEK